MPKFKAELFENALDSLNEALVKYQEGKSGDEKAYKFCVQHISHFLELILKYYVTHSHPLLIYKNPFAKDLDAGSQTIGLHEALNFLRNEGHQISEKFEEDMRWLKKLRNNIEHHKFSMDLDEVDETVGRLMSAVVEFNEAYEGVDFGPFINAEQYELFHELANTYEGRLKKAEEVVEESDSDVYQCYECNHNMIISSEESETGYQCAFCGNTESEDIEVDCSRCGAQWPQYDMKYIDWADNGIVDPYCPWCLHDPRYRKED